jgi:hypothetical protein
MQKLTKLDVTKIATNFVVGAGVSKIVKDIIVNNTHVETTNQKVVVFAGALVIGMMAKDATKSYTNAKIDSYVRLWEASQAKITEKHEENHQEQ